jgi:hypothetical protein
LRDFYIFCEYLKKFTELRLFYFWLFVLIIKYRVDDSDFVIAGQGLLFSASEKRGQIPHFRSELPQANMICQNEGGLL